MIEKINVVTYDRVSVLLPRNLFIYIFFEVGLGNIWKFLHSIRLFEVFLCVKKKLF